MKEAGLPGPVSPVPVPVGVGPEIETGPVPLPAILIAALVTTPMLKRVGKSAVQVSIGIPCFVPFRINFCGWSSSGSYELIPYDAVDGGWSPWLKASNCSVLCGGGVQLFVRKCNNPVPANGGKDCEGPKSKSESCAYCPCK